VRRPHEVRPADATARAVVSQRKRAAAAQAPAVQYPAGHFLALVREHNWPPRFEPRIEWGGPAKRSPDQTRANGGFDTHALGLPGALPYTTRKGAPL
jgi:hypothetical protein